MRTFYTINDKRTFSVSTGGELSFDIGQLFTRAVVARRDGKSYPHIHRIGIKVTAGIKQLNGAGAVKGIDLPAALTVFFQKDAADGGTIVIPGIPGDLIYADSQFAYGGCGLAYAPASDIAANGSGSTVTTDRTFYLWLHFEEPTAFGGDTNEVIPIAQLERGVFKVTVLDLATVWGDANLSYDTTHECSVDLLFDVVDHDHPINPQDVRWVMTSGRSSDTGTVAGFELPAGNYKRLIWHVRRLGNGGGESTSKLTNIDSVDGGQPEAFPASKSADDYNQMYRRAGALLAWIDGGTTSLIAQGKVCVLKAVPPGFGMFREFFQTPAKFKLNLTCGSSLVNPHRFFAKMIKVANPAVAAKTAAAAGIRGPATPLSETADGNSVYAERALLLPMTIEEGAKPDTRVRAVK